MAIATVVRYGYTIPHTPETALAAGDIVDFGTFVGVAVVDIPADTHGDLHVGWDSPTVRVTKYEDEAIAQGAIVYWDAGTSTATGTVGYSEGIFGYAVEAAAEGDATVIVKMSPP